MQTPTCSPEFPWACPPDVRKQMLRNMWLDEIEKKLRSFDGSFADWEIVNAPTQPPVSGRDVAVKKIEPGFRPPELPKDIVTFDESKHFDIVLPDGTVKHVDVKQILKPFPEHPAAHKVVNDTTFEKVVDMIEEQRRREAELGERLDQAKSVGGGRLPRMIELPDLFIDLPPWRWAQPKPIELLGSGRRRGVLA